MRAEMRALINARNARKRVRALKTYKNQYVGNARTFNARKKVRALKNLMISICAHARTFYPLKGVWGEPLEALSPYPKEI
jgi:hypothetical protein